MDLAEGYGPCPSVRGLGRSGTRTTCECTSAHNLIKNADLKRLVSDFNRRREAILAATGGS